MKSLIPLAVFTSLILAYVIFSYSLTSPNLVLTSWQPYWQFQTWIWQTLFNNAQLLTYYFVAIITGLWISYCWLLLGQKKFFAGLVGWQRWLLVGVVSAPLVIASNALSYDVFNYLFNAKMIVVYGANPHISTALDFSQDLWVRFMHNIHTPAPYGYGWSGLSLLPYALGGGKLLPTLLSFRVFSWLSYLLLAGLYFSRAKNQPWLTWAVLLNPLVLIEIIGNSHNDLWMAVPAVASLLLVVKPTKKSVGSFFTIVGSALLLAASISIKLATVAVLPVWLLLVAWPWLRLQFKKIPLLLQLLESVYQNWALTASFLLFVPLLTERSKYFLPWYITWSLVWLPFIAVRKLGKRNSIGQRLERWWIIVVLSFSLSSLYRYVPFLLTGTYDGQVVPNQIAVTWLGGVVLALCTMLFAHMRQTYFSGKMNV